MKSTVRISKDPATFDDYMNRTDDLQLEIVPPATKKNFELWGWLSEESDKWTEFRKRSNELFAILNDPEKTGPAARKNMFDHISMVRLYDNSKTDGHHLLDMVALKGSVSDCRNFNVVRGTILAADPVRHKADPVAFKPVLSFKKFDLGVHVIGVECADSPTSRRLPDGMKFAKIYRYIGSTPPAKLSQYEFAGNAKYGLYTSDFAELEPAEDETLEAWYFGRYESKNGLLGNPGPIIKAPVMLAEP